MGVLADTALLEGILDEMVPFREADTKEA